jgi:hypothetical protein
MKYYSIVFYFVALLFASFTPADTSKFLYSSKYINSTSNNNTFLYRKINYTDDAIAWCNYIHTSEEPIILLYNRLPKCGSSTMQYLFQKLSKQNKFITLSVNNTFWTDLESDKNKHLRKKFIHQINEKRKDGKFQLGKRIIVDGHWLQTEFKYKNFHQPFEYIQLIRECHSRRRSFFYYSLYDSYASRHAKINNMSWEHLQHVLHSNDPDSCLNDTSCLLKSGNHAFTKNPIELKHICGTKCNMKQNEPNKSLMRLIDHNRLTVLGILEKMNEFIEMLECAYPNFLRGIGSIYMEAVAYQVKRN